MITISINPQTPAHMAILGKALIALLGEDNPATVAEAAQEPAPAEDTPAKRTRRTKEEMAAVQAPKPVSAPETAISEEPKTAQEPTATEPTKPITLEEVRAKLAAISQSGKTTAVKELLTAFGVAKLTDLKADQYATILEKAAAL